MGSNGEVRSRAISFGYTYYSHGYGVVGWMSRQFSRTSRKKGDGDNSCRMGIVCGAGGKTKNNISKPAAYEKVVISVCTLL